MAKIDVSNANELLAAMRTATSSDYINLLNDIEMVDSVVESTITFNSKIEGNGYKINGLTYYGTDNVIRCNTSFGSPNYTFKDVKFTNVSITYGGLLSQYVSMYNCEINGVIYKGFDVYYMNLTNCTLNVEVGGTFITSYAVSTLIDCYIIIKNLNVIPSITNGNINMTHCYIGGEYKIQLSNSSIFSYTSAQLAVKGSVVNIDINYQGATGNRNFFYAISQTDDINIINVDKINMGSWTINNQSYLAKCTDADMKNVTALQNKGFLIYA